MSLDAEGLRWCDKCWDNRARHIALNSDGSRTDLCDDDYDEKEEDAYVMSPGWLGAGR